MTIKCNQYWLLVHLLCQKDISKGSEKIYIDINIHKCHTIRNGKVTLLKATVHRNFFC